MTKTPEQMAEEYVDKNSGGECSDDTGGLRNAFLAGYQAAKDQLADVDKAMPKQDGDLLHKVANDYLDMKAARYRRVCGYKK